MGQGNENHVVTLCDWVFEQFACQNGEAFASAGGDQPWWVLPIVVWAKFGGV